MYKVIFTNDDNKTVTCVFVTELSFDQFTNDAVTAIGEQLDMYQCPKCLDMFDDCYIINNKCMGCGLEPDDDN